MTLTFNQIQFRVFLFVFLLFTGGALGYRYFIELPKLNKSFAAIIEKELATLKFSIQGELKGLAASNFDYAVWTATYKYMSNTYPGFFEENIVENTFNGLNIDGMFFIGKDFELYSAHEKGDLSGKSLTYSFFDFNKYPENLLMLPKAITETGAPKQSGFILTQKGPAMYSTSQIRNSNMEGDNLGYLIMIRLLDNEFIEKLSRYSSTQVSLQPLSINRAEGDVFLWDDNHIVDDFHSLNYVQINDFEGGLVTFLAVQNGITENSSLLSREIIQFFLITLFLLLVAYNLISTKIIKPVKGFAIQIKKIDLEKGLTLLDEDHEVQELNMVSNHFNQLATTIKDQTELLAQQVSTDQLTQILNRRGLIDALEIYKEQCIRHNIGFILVMSDIDHFKLYNDFLGHIEGDIALIKVAQTLKDQCLRASDICGRFGGEEFTLMYTDMTEPNLHKKLENIVQAMQQLNIAHPKSPTKEHITISLGATIVKPSDVKDYNLSSEDIYKQADNALYQAKASGRNGFVINHFSDFYNTPS